MHPCFHSGTDKIVVTHATWGSTVGKRHRTDLKPPHTHQRASPTTSTILLIRITQHLNGTRDMMIQLTHASS
eukprot:CAMPEP_0173120944 /NCGR_PEP_ID=MMETSP1102-20130122/52907_1 /TAXON_ID=49646 /ORGANISM="Geminigera sp., Strain Caron Lab Isolate" /LENGTH=71 /DNA_ID=CAMNT_0014027287 /DNA_START=619 /DNA_END=834 /DNA_ORIENTATION=+